MRSVSAQRELAPQSPASRWVRHALRPCRSHHTLRQASWDGTHDAPDLKLPRVCERFEVTHPLPSPPRSLDAPSVNPAATVATADTQTAHHEDQYARRPTDQIIRDHTLSCSGSTTRENALGTVVFNCFPVGGGGAAGLCPTQTVGNSKGRGSL